MSAALLPCPFCGAPAEIEHGSDHHGEWFNLGCSRHWGKDPDSPCVGGRLWYTETEVTEADAIAAWNRRAPSPAEAALREALAALVNAKALSEVEEMVAGWNGPPEKPYERHPSRLGATIQTNCGRVYDLADAMAAARAALAALAAEGGAS
jgi:hypothetical protein